MSRGDILLHCGGQPADFQEICAVEVPEQTETYRPVPHGDLVRLIQEEVATRIGLADPRQTFGLNRHGKQLFGTLVYDLGEQPDVDMLAAFGQGELKEAIAKAYGYTIAFRNSYDKTMGLGIVGGVTTFVCDNLCLSGSDFTIHLPHTKNVWERAVPEVMVKVKESIGQFQHSVQFLERMKGLRLDEDRAYEMIGLARGRGVLTQRQSTACFEDFRAMKKAAKLPDHFTHTFANHAGSAYGLYQNFTQALKLGADVSRRIDVYTGASRLFEEKILN
jgi:hypothetical protein